MNARRSAAGLTLVELMIALAIASFTLLGAVRLYAHTAAMIRTGHSVQALEEAAQQALNVLRRDGELAGFFGLMSDDATDRLAATQMQSLTVRNDCGEDWSVNVNEAISGSDNSYGWDCRAYAGLPASGADTVVLRFSGPQPVAFLEPGRVYLRSFAAGHGEVFIASGTAETQEQQLSLLQALHTRGYYVSRVSVGSSDGLNTPALRVKHLTERNGRAIVADEEIQPGIEDMQIEFGTAIDRFISPAGLADDDHIRAIRVWLLVRSTTRENGLGIYTIPAFANRPMRTYSDGYRRRLVSTTIRIGHDRPL